MDSPIDIGDTVQTVLGKGIVREVRRHDRLLVEVKGRTIELDAHAVSRLDGGALKRMRRRAPDPAPAAKESVAPIGTPAELDLHGLTVDEALARVDAMLNDALLADRSEVRLIHGRSGGRIRAALHRRLREIPSVRAFHLDPRNSGVTIVVL